MFGNKRLDELEELVGGLEFRLNRLEKDIKGLYIFINAYVERVEQDESVLKEVKPMLEEVSVTLRKIAEGFA